MEPKTFVIRSQEIIDRVVSFLKAHPKEPVLEVVIREYKKDRSVLQNSLYWLWNTTIAHELGSTKEDVHFDLKYRILCRIYERDDLEYGKMLNAVRKLKFMGLFDEHKVFVGNIVKLTSTTTATVKQFAEYLTEIERDMANKGIALPHPEDRYYDSLMKN